MTNPLDKIIRGVVKSARPTGGRVPDLVSKISGLSQVPAPQDEALRLAQQRAALPVKKGGLGLPKNNTAAQRAKAMDFTGKGYHGSLSDIKKFLESKASTESHAGRGTYITDSPEDASLNYASIFGPDVKGKVERSIENFEDGRSNPTNRIEKRFRDENLTPLQQEILLANTIRADNLGVVYPLLYRSDKAINLDFKNPRSSDVGPFEKYDPKLDEYTETAAAQNLGEALREYESAGGNSSYIHDVLADSAGEAIPAVALYKAAQKGASNMMDEFTGDIISGGVAGSDFVKNLGVDQIEHTPTFRNQQLNLGTQHTVAMNPDNIRVPSAAFDPFRRTAAIAAAMGVAAPDLLAAEPKKKAKGGAVSQDAMNLSVMNQKVQRKMGGGGAKSKNAPKFTEAITQGLGPMLYGAARGTAAGLAGLGGDIEELARLGINYAGDKLQGRFPNMLDKRDVVSPKATLPTSERVLSKIPSLKDFGAGPEARHSEDIAAKLGMYGLTNIAAPKAGKAVVQGVNATGKALAPKAGEMLENYMVRTGGILPMDVWHGSPHRFPPTAKNPLGEFDATKIGTGEGAQAYGHGHYLAEARGVGSGYRDRLSQVKTDGGWDKIPRFATYGKTNPRRVDMNAPSNTLTPGETALTYINMNNGSKYEAGVAMREMIDAGVPDAAHYKKALSVLDRMKLKDVGQDFGALYKVDLPDEQIAKMLDWDKPLSEQPDVIKALKGTDYEVGVSQKEAEKIADMRLRQEADDWAEMTGGDPVDYSNNVDWEKYVDNVRKESGSVDSSITGKDLHRMVMRDEGYRPQLFDSENYQVGTSEALRGMGVPGIRYLDGGSRAGGKGTSNFVVFPGNEEMLNILSREKDGGLVHGKKNGGEAKKPFSNDFERRQQMAGSVMPSQREMEEALRPATVNSLLKRAADRRQGKAMQEEPESPETQPEGEVRPYDPTFRQDKSAKIQRGLESLGVPIPRARSIAQNIMGEGGIGIADFVPFVGTGMSLQETKRAVERARDKGDQTGVVTELGLGALNAAAGLWGTNALAKTLASSIKKSPYQRYSQAEFDRILREGELKQLPAPPAPPKLLNGPTEQRLLNAPKREKTVFEMQQELAQKHAMLPKSQYGLELPPGNTAAQRADVMFPVNAYHGTADDIAAFDLSQSGRHLTKDWGNAVSLSPSSSNAEYYAVNAGSAPEKNAAFARYEANPTNEALIEFRKAARLAEVNPTGANIMPLRLDASRSEDYLVQSGRNDPFLYQNSRMKENKKDVAKILDNPNVISEYAVYNPDKIRSRFAAFDPFRRNAAIAAATGSVAPDLLAEEYANGGEVTSDDLILIERKR